MAEEKEEKTSQKPEEEVDSEKETTSEDGSSLKKKNKQLYARAKKAEEESKALKQELEKYEDKETKEGIDKEGKDRDAWRGKVEFLLQNQDKNYSEDEFDHISNVAYRKGIDFDEAAKQEDDYIQFKRQKVQKSKQTPGPSSPSSKSGKKSPKEIRDMDDEEFKEYVKSQEKARGESSGV